MPHHLDQTSATSLRAGLRRVAVVVWVLAQVLVRGFLELLVIIGLMLVGELIEVGAWGAAAVTLVLVVAFAFGTGVFRAETAVLNDKEDVEGLEDVVLTAAREKIGTAVVNVRENLAPRTENIRIKRPPGFRVSGVLRLLFGRKAFERVFGQVVASAHEEWMDAAASGDKTVLRRLRLHTPIHVLIAAATYLLICVAKQVDVLRKILKG